MEITNEPGGPVAEEMGKLRLRIAELEEEQAKARELAAQRDVELDRFRSLIEFLPQSVFEADLEGRLLYLNQYGHEVSGYTPEDLAQGRTMFDVITPEQHDMLRANMVRALQEQTMMPSEYVVRLKDGNLVPVAAYSIPFFKDARPAGFRGLLVDITHLRKAEEELRRLNALVETTSDIVGTACEDGSIAYMNQAGRKMFGWASKGSLSTYQHQDLAPLWVEEKRKTEVQRALDRDGIWSGEMAVIDRDGQEIPVSQVIIAHRSESDGKRYTSTIIRDISTRKQIEEALRDSETRYRDTLDALGDLVHVIDEDYKIIICNHRFDAWQKELGLASLSPGSNLFDIFPFLGANVMEEYQHVFRTGEMLVTEESNRFGDVDIYTDTRKFPVFAGGKIAGVVTVIRDITARKKAQLDLLSIQSSLEEKVRARTQQLLEINVRLQDEVNRRAETELELRAHEELLQIERNLALSLGQAANMRGLLELLLTAALHLDGIDLGGVYILEQEVGDMHLVVHHNLSAYFVEAASYYGPDAPQTHAVLSGRILYLSKEEIPFDDPALRMEGIKSLAVIPVQHQGKSVACLNVASRTLEQFPASTRRALEATATHIGDVVERMRSLERLQESEENFRRSFEDSSDAILWIDTSSGVVINANNAAEALFERSTKEMIGQNFLMLNEHWDHAEAEKIFRTCAEQESRSEMELKIISRDGSPRNLNIVVNTIHLRGRRILAVVLRDITKLKSLEVERARLFTAIEQSDEMVVITDRHGVIEYVNPAFEAVTQYTKEEAIGQRPSILKSGRQTAKFYRKLWDTILGGNTWRGHFINRRKDGRLYEEDAIISPVVNPSGVIEQFVAMMSDVTEYTEVERQLRQAQRVESLGALASGMAHDFKNFLSMISGYSEIAANLVAGNSRAETCVQRIRATAERASVMVNRVLSFGQSSEHEVRPVPLDKLVEEALEIVRPSAPHSVTLRSEIEGGKHTIVADPAMIHQVIVNLCTNAVHAMADGGGVLELELKTVDYWAGAPIDERAAGPSKYEQLRISDTGHGMDLATLERIFIPFFTTRKRSGGTGLGLAIAQKTIHNAGGSIEVQSTPGKGTTFLIHLPRHEDPVSAHHDGDGGVNEPTCRVLFVDDEEDIAFMSQLGLEQLGYVVETFTQGAEALKALREDPNRFDVLITDFMMPTMSGLDLAKECRVIRPNLPIIVISGLEERTVSEDASYYDEWTNKPITPSLLALALSRVLDAKASK